MNRETQIINCVIQFPNSVQPIQGLPVAMTAADIITNESGDQIGYPHQYQRFLIPDDITPELVDMFNGSLATIGYKLVSIAEE